MRLVALNDKLAAFEQGGPGLLPDPRAALNRLVAMRSWKDLVSFLKNEGCNQLFAKREAEVLHDPDDFERDGRLNVARESPSFVHGQPSRTLGAVIDMDGSIDFLDDLTKGDLIRDGEVYEVLIQELLAYREELRRFLIMAAVALGEEGPRDLFFSRSLDQLIDFSDSQVVHRFSSFFEQYFGHQCQIEALSFNSDFWPITSFGPFSYDGPLSTGICDGLGDGLQLGYSEERQVGILSGIISAGSATGEQEDFAVFYNSSKHSRDEACRLFCGLSLSRIIDAYRHDKHPHRAFFHNYVDEPDFNESTRFDMSTGFDNPNHRNGFLCWQSELVREAISATFDKRVKLCPLCKTPIVLATSRSRNVYCCDSHKALASIRRREQAHRLYAAKVPLEDAIAKIGPAFKASVTKWYQEASALSDFDE